MAGDMQVSKIVAEVERLLQAHRSLDALAADFSDLLIADLSLSKISSKLRSWYELSSKDFIEQLEAAKNT